MKHILFGKDAENLQLAILIKEYCFTTQQLNNNYVNHLVKQGISPETIIAFTLKYQTPKKCPAAYAKDYLGTLLSHIESLGIKTLMVCDSIYFKQLTGKVTIDPHHGYVLKCSIKGYEHINVILSINYQAIIYNPALQDKLNISIDTVVKHLQGNHIIPGTNIIHYEYYPNTMIGIKMLLRRLHQHKVLTCDIETKSLDFYTCGISTIAFAWNEHEGVAFPIDRGSYPSRTKMLLRAFLEEYEGTLIYHNAGFDIKVLIYELFMENLADYEGMLHGLHIMTENFEDTKLIAYLATNNAVENVLGLKPLAQEFAGNYAQDNITDTTKIKFDDLLRYNLIDCLSTWYVYNKYYPIMVSDQQKQLYVDLFKPTAKTLIQTELCGMPVDPTKVQEVKAELFITQINHLNYFKTSPIIKDFHHTQLQLLVDKANSKLKKKVRVIADVQHIEFNPGSDTQLQALIYDYLNYDIIDLTKGKNPATGEKTLKKLKAHSKCQEHTDIFDHLIGLANVGIILSTFIPALEKAQQLPDGSYRLYGNFNLGGTQSLRLSSSNPNLQNLPVKGKYGKMIKECFISPPGWIFSGSDFDSLEDKANALVTKDPNKIKVYVDGYDAHSLRTFFYFRPLLPDIVDTVTSINSIQEKYKALREKSKAPTFAMTYMGTFITLMKNCGFSEDEAKSIEANYKILYQVAIQWINDRIKEAETLGYVPLAFGGRIRTPRIAQSINNIAATPFMVAEEARSAGNAATQSYCFLTSRAANEFMKKVWKSDYKYDILPIAQIHDAIYILFRNNIKIAKWVNDNLITCMAWQDLPELQHDFVKISSSLEVFYKNWCNPIELPKFAECEDILQICKQEKENYDSKTKTILS